MVLGGVVGKLRANVIWVEVTRGLTVRLVRHGVVNVFGTQPVARVYSHASGIAWTCAVPWRRR